MEARYPPLSGICNLQRTLPINFARGNEDIRTGPSIRVPYPGCWDFDTLTAVLVLLFDGHRTTPSAVRPYTGAIRLYSPHQIRPLSRSFSLNLFPPFLLPYRGTNSHITFQSHTLRYPSIFPINSRFLSKQSNPANVKFSFL